MNIDARFPGGNIVLDGIDGDNVLLHQDLRDTEGDWFSWYFRLTGGAGRTLRFRFTRGPAIGARGPAASWDGGHSWQWLGADAVEGNGFAYTVPAGVEAAYFGFGIPYVEADFLKFSARYAGRPDFRLETLCRSAAGRPVECIRAGCPADRAASRLLLTCRHHACEAVANFVLEGFLDHALGPEPLARHWREKTEFLVVPFVDKDGVENGDQGKNRAPHDHYRDYADPGIYPETTALRDHAARWSADGRLRMALDLHCPWMKGPRSECIHLVGLPDPAVWARQSEFSRLLARTQTGALVYHPEDDLPWGQGWNTEANEIRGRSFARWAAGLPGMLYPVSVEFPYANARGGEVNAATARAFGADLARAAALTLAAATNRE